MDEYIRGDIGHLSCDVCAKNCPCGAQNHSKFIILWFIKQIIRGDSCDVCAKNCGACELNSLYCDS